VEPQIPVFYVSNGERHYNIKYGLGLFGRMFLVDRVLPISFSPDYTCF
jgi:hypothetical protein